MNLGADRDDLEEESKVDLYKAYVNACPELLKACKFEKLRYEHTDVTRSPKETVCCARVIILVLEWHEQGVIGEHLNRDTVEWASNIRRAAAANYAKGLA